MKIYRLNLTFKYNFRIFIYTIYNKRDTKLNKDKRLYFYNLTYTLSLVILILNLVM